MITDYKPFLRVTNGHIWWDLKDARRLGAGYRPIRNDKSMTTNLQAFDDQAQVNELTLLGAFNNTQLTIERPITFERDGFQYVDAEGFLVWLEQYIIQTQATEIPFPEELANAVRKTIAKAAASPQPDDVKFESLILALEGWFDKKLEDLPEAVRHRIERYFSPIPWDNLSAGQRRSVAFQWDNQHDPANEQEREYWFNFFAHWSDLKADLEKWQATAAPTASDLALKETRIKELQREIDRMELQKRRARGDFFSGRKILDTDVKTAPEYIDYPKAMKILQEKWGATPEELAVWVNIEPDMGGIPAYRNANELNPPPRFYYSNYYGSEDCLSPLMACWFRQRDIEDFLPVDRYITGDALIQRWGNMPGRRPEAFIYAKITESRLEVVHPTFGFDDKQLQTLPDGIFSMKAIKEIEVEDGIDVDSSPSALHSGRDHLESVAGITWNQWPASTGITGRNQWNTQATPAGRLSRARTAAAMDWAKGGTGAGQNTLQRKST